MTITDGSSLDEHAPGRVTHGWAARLARLPGVGGLAAWEWVGLGAIVGLYAVLGTALILQRAPLGHDEAVYALRARFLAGEHGDVGYWNDYRAPGLPLIMRLVLPFGDTDGYLRSVVLLVAVAGIVVTWLWARRWFGPRAALVAAALLATAPWYLRTGTRIFVDAPGATFGVATVAVFALAIGRERISRWALLTVPVAALATLNRYGAPTLVAGGLTVVALAHWRQVLRSWRLVAVVGAGTAAAVGAILLVPAVTGSAQAPLRAFRARQDAKGIGAFASYGDFNEHWPRVLGGPVGLVVVVGVVLALVALTRRGDTRGRIAIVLGVFVVSYALLNAGLAQGFPMYLVPMLPLVMIVAAAGLAPLLDRVNVATVLALVAALLAVTAVPAYRAGQQAVRLQERNFDLLEQSAVAIGRERAGNCVVVASYSPQVAWYSRCLSLGYPSRFADEGFGDQVRDYLACLHESADPGSEVFWLLAKGGKRQPDPPSERRLKAVTQQVELAVGDPGAGRLGFVEVGRLGTYEELAAGTPSELEARCQRFYLSQVPGAR